MLHLWARGGGKTLEAAIWLRGRRYVKIWSGYTGPQGVDREWSQHLLVDPTNHQNVPVIVYQNMRGLWRCDGLLAQALRRAYLFRKRRFVPLFGSMPKGPGIHRLTAQTTPPPGVRRSPVAPFRFTAASSQLGCGGQASRVTPPSELHDGKVATAWVEGWGGVGRGELVSGMGTKGYRVRAVRIVPGHGASAATWARHNRLKRVYLLLGPRSRFEVVFPTDPGRSPPGTPYWVSFPRPVSSSCLTLVIRDVYPGTEHDPARGKFGDTAISEITVFSDLDFGDSYKVILRDAGKGRLERLTAVRMLSRLGKSLAPKLRAAFPKAVSSTEREVLLRALAHLDPLGSVKELARGMGEATGALRGRLMRALVRAGDPAVPALEAMAMQRISGSLYRLVVRALQRIASSHAAQTLVGMLTRGQSRHRILVARALAKMPPTLARRPLLDALHVRKRPPRVRADLVRLLGLLAVAHRSMRALAISEARSMLASDRRFAVTYMLIDLMGAIPHPSFVQPLLKLVRGKRDPILRAKAVAALANQPEAEAGRALARALDDPHPRVRGAALVAWSGRASQPSVASVLRLAQKDPWPMVRVAATRALGARCRGAAALLTLARGRTGWRYRRVRRVALTAAFRCKVPGLRPLLRSILTADNEWVPLRTLSVRLLGQLLDRRRVVYMAELLSLLARQVRKPRSRNELLAVALALALGRIQDRRGLKALALAARVKLLHGLRAAAITGLGGFCAPATRAVVRAGLDSTSSLVLHASRRTIKRCGW